jgi:recombination protein RecA
MALGTELVASISSMRDDLQAFLDRARARARPTAALAKIVPLDELRRTRDTGGKDDPAASDGALALALSFAEPRAEAASDEDRLSFEALRGRLVELSSDRSAAALSSAVNLTLQAQRAGDQVAWIQLRASSFYLPDVVECGVDISALAVIRVSDMVVAGRAAERLLRSSAFGLVIVDLGAPDCVIERDGIHQPGTKALSVANQGRLVSLAQQADSLVVCLTNKKLSSDSMGSLISLRADASRERDDEGFRITLRVLKDKRRGPGWIRRERAKGPSGLT